MRQLISILTASFLIAAAAQADPHLAAPAPKFDFGVIPSNSQLVHKFWVKSTGTDTVNITEIKTGCSCVVSDQASTKVAPGDSLLLGFSWDTKRMRGTIYRSPRVFYDGAANPVILQMSAVTYDYPDSARPVTLKPYRFEFGRTSRGDIDSIGFTVTNHSDEDLTIDVISAPDSGVDVVMPNAVPAGGQATGYALLQKEAKDTEFETSLTIMVSDPKSTHLSVPIRRKIY